MIVELCGDYLSCILPIAFVYFVVDWVVSNVLSLISGNGLSFRPFRVGKVVKRDE